MCFKRCIGKENREKQFHKSEFRSERGGENEIKDSKNEPVADVESQHANATIFLNFPFSPLENQVCAAFAFGYFI